MSWRSVVEAVYMAGKRRGGFVDMAQDVRIAGTVAYTERSPDGDLSFDLMPDDTRERACYFGTDWYPLIHCEVSFGAPEELRADAARLRVGYRVAVSGRLAFDGNHHGHGVLLDVLAAIVGWPPNTRDGWLEIHPVTRIESV